MQRLPLANREPELECFAGMVAGTSGERILLLEAGGGMGKTTLMAEFVRHCHSAGMPCVPVDLKGDPGLSEVLARLCDGLGWEGFPTLAARVQELGRGGGQAAETAFEHIHREDYNRAAIRDLVVEAFNIVELKAFFFDRPEFNIDLDMFSEGANRTALVMEVILSCQRDMQLDELLVGLREEKFERYKRHYARIYRIEAETMSGKETVREARAGLGRAEIRDALRTADERDRATRRGALTRALFEDLGAREGRLAILFDTCEQAGPEVREWLEEAFLAHASRATDLVVVIAGREAPDTRLEWEAYCHHRVLGNLRDPGLWQEYAEEIGAEVPYAEGIAAYCDLLDGHPDAMMKALARYMPGGGGR